MVRLPRIIERRLALARIEDPRAIDRHRRDEPYRWFGLIFGAVTGSAGLAAGLWMGAVGR